MDYESWLVKAILKARRATRREDNEWEIGQYQALKLALEKYREIELGVDE